MKTTDPSQQTNKSAVKEPALWRTSSKGLQKGTRAARVREGTAGLATDNSLKATGWDTMQSGTPGTGYRRDPHLDAAPPAVLGPELQGAEPAHIFRIMEHPADHGFPLVDFDWKAGQDDLLQHHSVGIGPLQHPCGTRNLCSAHLRRDRPLSAPLRDKESLSSTTQSQSAPFSTLAGQGISVQRGAVSASAMLASWGKGEGVGVGKEGERGGVGEKRGAQPCAKATARPRTDAGTKRC
jgi:hypothetical protein